MLLALSTGHKAGLATVAVIFILFALVSSFVLPRLNPSFPGGRLGLFLVAVLALTVAQLTAVVVFAGESEAGKETTTETTPPPRSTTTTAPTGSPAAGKAVFNSAGCSACHTLAAANAKGTVGPDLDKVLKGKDAAFIHQSIVDPNAEIAPGYQPGIMPQNFKDTLSGQQLNDVIALLFQST